MDARLRGDDERLRCWKATKGPGNGDRLSPLPRADAPRGQGPRIWIPAWTGMTGRGGAYRDHLSPLRKQGPMPRLYSGSRRGNGNCVWNALKQAPSFFWPWIPARAGVTSACKASFGCPACEACPASPQLLGSCVRRNDGNLSRLYATGRCPASGFPPAVSSIQGQVPASSPQGQACAQEMTSKQISGIICSDRASQSSGTPGDFVFKCVGQ